MVDMRDRRVHGTQADAGGGAAVLCRAEGAGAGGHGGLRQHAVVRALAGCRWALSCGWAMRARSGPWKCASRRRTVAMRSCCCSCCWRIAFPRYGCRALEQRDTRQLLLHRHKLVGMRRQVKNELQHLALNQGVQQKRKLWSAAGRQRLEELPLTGWTAQRREDSLELLDDLDRPHRQAGYGGAAGGGSRCGGPVVADASRSGSDHGAGVFADAGRDRALRAQPPGGQLPGAESGGAFQRRAAAAGRRSASRAIPCCAVCWWKRDRARRVRSQS